MMPRLLEVQPLATSLSPKGNKGGRAYTSTYRVITSAKWAGPVEIVLRTAGQGLLPQWGEPYIWLDPTDPSANQYDTSAFCVWPPAVEREYGAKDQAGRLFWLVTYRHESAEDSNTRGDQSGNPLNEGWEIEADADEWTEEATKDEDGNPITNSSLETVKGKQVQVFKSRGRYRLAINVASISSEVLEDIRLSVNKSATWLDGKSWPARTLLMRRIRKSRRPYANGLYFERVDMEIDCNSETHDLAFVDMGFREFTGTNRNDPKHFSLIKDNRTKQNAATPVLLDGNGAPLAAGLPAVKVTKRFYKQRNWPFIFP